MTMLEAIGFCGLAGAVGGALMFRFGGLWEMVTGAVVGAPIVAGIGCILWLANSLVH